MQPNIHAINVTIIMCWDATVVLEMLYSVSPVCLSRHHVYKCQTTCTMFVVKYYLIKNSQVVKKGAAPKKAMVKKDVISKVAAKKWL